MLLKSNFLAGLFFKGKFELNLTLTHTIFTVLDIHDLKRSSVTAFQLVWPRTK